MREESWRRTKEMRLVMSGAHYLRIDRQIKKKTRKTRSMEQKRLRRKVFNIRRRKEDCERHLLCKWIKKFMYQILIDRKEDVSFRDSGEIGGEIGGEKGVEDEPKSEDREKHFSSIVQ